MKRIVVCFDGTWCQPQEIAVSNTNVRKMYDAVASQDQYNIQQVKWYDSGVGTHWYDKIPGGIAGVGLSVNIKQGYKQLALNYEPGDEIFIWGFSRGAYTARSLVGLIRNSGLLKKSNVTDKNIHYAYSIYRTRDESADTPQATAFRDQYSRQVDIKFLGVWDTVGALGIPFPSFDFFNRSFYEFHDTQLSKIVKNAFQALAVDEHRKVFDATLWTPNENPTSRMEQIWFAGSHGDIGGGGDTPDGLLLSDITLAWMIQKAQSCDLAFQNTTALNNLSSLTHIPVTNSRKGIYELTKAINRKIGFSKFGHEQIHDTLNQLVKSSAGYRPENVVGQFIQNLLVPGNNKLY